MRFLVDAQLPPALCRWLQSQGHQADYVGSLLPGETSDDAIAAFAAEHDWVLISKDEDFLTRHPTDRLCTRLGSSRKRQQPGVDRLARTAIAGDHYRAHRR